MKTDNFVQKFEAAENFLLYPFASLGRMNLAPYPQKIWKKQIDVSKVNIYPDWNRDFDGQSSESRYGAYAYDGHPKWNPSLEIKPEFALP